MILVTGPTGNVGGELVCVLADGSQRVRAPIRAEADRPQRLYA
jgi:hypothetical protein